MKIDDIESHMRTEADQYCTIRRGNHDCSFYGQWLLKAAEANGSLNTIRASKHVEFPELDLLDGVYILELDSVGRSLLGKLLVHKKVVVPVFSHEAAILALLQELNFVHPDGADYFLSLPTTISSESVEQAIVIVGRTVDSHFYLHPGHLLRCRSGIGKLKKTGPIGWWGEGA